MAESDGCDKDRKLPNYRKMIENYLPNYRKWYKMQFRFCKNII